VIKSNETLNAFYLLLRSILSRDRKNEEKEKHNAEDIGISYNNMQCQNRKITLSRRNNYDATIDVWSTNMARLKITNWVRNTTIFP